MTRLKKSALILVFKELGVLISGVLLLLATGCTSVARTESSLLACDTLSCLRGVGQRQIAQQCMKNLFFYERRSTRMREMISQEYRYPLTSWDSYLALKRVGGNGPDPWKWCQHYAKQKSLPTWTVAKQD
jgi:hypothetical protein